MTTQIRVALNEDQNAIREIWETSGLESATETEWQALLGNSRTTLIVAEDEGSVIGAAIAAFDGWRAFVYHVGVAASHRRKGVATGLLKAAETDVGRRGARRIFAIVNESMTDGLALCAEHGYEPEGDLILVKEL